MATRSVARGGVSEGEAHETEIPAGSSECTCTLGWSLAQDCEGWTTSVFFLSATPAEVESCLAAGADVNAQSAGSRNTPLHLAVRFGHNPVVIEILLDAGADATAQDLAGKTPWDYVKDRAEFDAHWQLNEVQELATDPEDLAQAGGATRAQTLLGTIGAGFGASKDRVVHWAFTIRDLFMIGFAKVKEYADAIIVVTVAASDAVKSSPSFQKAIGVVGSPATFLRRNGHLSSFAANLDWSKIDATKYLRAGTRGVSRSIEAAKGVWETIPLQIRARGSEVTLTGVERLQQDLSQTGFALEKSSLCQPPSHFLAITSTTRILCTRKDLGTKQPRERPNIQGGIHASGGSEVPPGRADI